MKKSDIYEIAIKILGLYLFFTCLGLLSDVLATVTLMSQSEQYSAEDNGMYLTLLILSTAHFVFVIAFASFLTFKTKPIVKFVCKPEDYEETSTLFADRKVIYEMALVVMGLLLFVWTLPEFILKLKNYFQVAQMNFPNKEHDTNFLITSGIKIAVSLIAIIYAKSITTAIIRDTKSGQTD